MNPECQCLNAESKWIPEAQKWLCLKCKEWINPPPPKKAADLESSIKKIANHDQWCTKIMEHWPAPIAFTYHLLQKKLGKGNLDASVWILKDLGELLARFSALIMARDILAHGTREQQFAARKELFGKPFSMGKWLSFAESMAKIIQDDAIEFSFPELANLWLITNEKKRNATPLKKFVENLVYWRNDRLGHGVRGDDSTLIMNELEKFLKESPDSLHNVLAPYESLFDKIWMTDPKGNPLMGKDAIVHVHDEAGKHALTSPIPLFLISNEKKLDLAPFITFRKCKTCKKQETFHYDYVKLKTPIPDVRVLSYESGHAFKEAADKVLHKEIRNVKKLGIKWEMIDDDAFTQDFLSEELGASLEEMTVDKSYVSPDYLRDSLHEFMQTRIEEGKGGIYWLRAPAHVGKTTFVRGLDPVYQDLLKEEEFAPGTSLFRVVFYIRREYQVHVAQMAEQLEDGLKKEYKSKSQEKKLPSLDINPPNNNYRKSMLEFLTNYQKIGNKPLLVIIDGLDELTQESPSIMDFLPTPNEMPANIFLLLTSRLLGELDPWLLQATDQLKDAQTLTIDLNNQEYINLMQKYAQKSFKNKKDENCIDTIFPILMEKSGGRFLYLNFLVDLWKDCNLDFDGLEKLSWNPEQLVPEYIKGILEKYSETPMESLIKQTILHLVLAEDVYDSHRKGILGFILSNEEDEDGNPVLSRDVGFDGISLKILCALVYDEERISPKLAMVIYLIKPLLRTCRKSKSTMLLRLWFKVAKNAFSYSEIEKISDNAINKIINFLSNLDTLDGISSEPSSEIAWYLMNLDGMVRKFPKSWQANLKERKFFELIFKNLKKYYFGLKTETSFELYIWTEIMSTAFSELDPENLKKFLTTESNDDAVEFLSPYLGIRFPEFAHNLSKLYIKNFSCDVILEQDYLDKAIRLMESIENKYNKYFTYEMSLSLGGFYNDVYLFSDDTDKAVMYWEKLYEKYQSREVVVEGLSEAYLSRGHSIEIFGDHESYYYYEGVSTKKEVYGFYKEAINYYQKSIDLLEEFFVKDFPEKSQTESKVKILARSYNGIGSCFINMNNVNKGISSYTKTTFLIEEWIKKNKGIYSFLIILELFETYKAIIDIIIKYKKDRVNSIAIYDKGIDLLEKNADALIKEISRKEMTRKLAGFCLEKAKFLFELKDYDSSYFSLRKVDKLLKDCPEFSGHEIFLNLEKQGLLSPSGLNSLLFRSYGQILSKPLPKLGSSG